MKDVINVCQLMESVMLTREVRRSFGRVCQLMERCDGHGGCKGV